MAIATLGVVVLDCPDPQALAGFYARVLGGEVVSDADGSVLRQGDRMLLAFQHSPGHTAPEWPRADRSQQFHLDLELPREELDAAHEQVVGWGAKLLDDGGGDRSWRVFADPAGHPFCLCGVRS
ncbi:VOC family protein [Streptacidiphilus albus]|uniref:VOC family protein n=1 Tax=Streptacidiphilus albus TaxID=105425 RepID=UPI00054C0D17|nr:VOC family protein [Streptacidiphilus albus]